MDKEEGIFHYDEYDYKFVAQKENLITYHCITKKCPSFLYFKDSIIESKAHNDVCKGRMRKLRVQKLVESKTNGIVGEFEKLRYYDKETIDLKIKWYEDKIENIKIKKLKTKSRIVWSLAEFQSSKSCEALTSITSVFNIRKSKFNDDLVWNESLVIDSSGSFELGDDNKLIFFQSKLNVLGNLFPPFMIVETDIPGNFAVKALNRVEKGTFICEYVGEIVKESYSTQSENKSDSYMMLTLGYDIYPDKISNIAKFLSSVGPNNKSDKNVKSQLSTIDGEYHVLLFAIEPIQAGELLYYDYNEGKKGKYDTSSFISLK
jgi:hypothetical protein